MLSEYCAVGPRFVLLGEGDKSAPRTLALRAEVRRAEPVARLTAALRDDDVVSLSGPETERPLSDADVLELVRLAARTSADFWAYRLPLEVRLARDSAAVRDGLAADGFSTTDGSRWRREPGLFPRQGAKARTVDELYADLYSVPWNFVPRESDVYGPMIDDARGAPLTVLDLGCGLGKNAPPLEALGWSVYGVDAARAAIRRCRAVVSRPERFVAGAAGRLPWASERFDCVLDVGALHCMPPDERRLAIAEIARVLAPAGRLYSRFFKPRPASWIEMLPMEVDRFGLPGDQVRALLGERFVCDSVTESSVATYVTARKRRL